MLKLISRVSAMLIREYNRMLKHIIVSIGYDILMSGIWLVHYVHQIILRQFCSKIDEEQCEMTALTCRLLRDPLI
jgi:hypothetical protein